jgi:hypothetical protein
VHGKTGSNEKAATFLEGYLTCAFENRVPIRSVSERLAEVFQSTWQQRSIKRVPQLRDNSTGNSSRSKAVESVENDGNTHRKPSTRAKKKEVKKKKLSPERMARQAIYVKRSVLRKQGVPEDQLPPLPPLNKAA